MLLKPETDRWQASAQIVPPQNGFQKQLSVLIIYYSPHLNVFDLYVHMRVHNIASSMHYAGILL